MSGLSDRRSKRHKSKPEDDHGELGSWLRAGLQPIRFPKWSLVCLHRHGNAWQWSKEKKDPFPIDVPRVRVVERRDQLPGPDVWLLARRSISDREQVAYYLAYAPPRTSFQTLIRVASSRYTVEQCIEEAKGETGLDEYEVRFWHSWYRHITLSTMAHAWLASIRGKTPEKKGQN